MRHPQLKKNLYLSEISMNKILVILTALLLSGCAAKVSQLQTPEKIEYNGKTYKLTASQDLDTIARYVYLAEPDTLENWQSQIEVLLDRDLSRSIEQRVALREKYIVIYVSKISKFEQIRIKEKTCNRVKRLCYLCTNRTESILAGRYCKRKKYSFLWFCAISIFPKVEQGKKFQRLSKVKIVKIYKNI